MTAFRTEIKPIKSKHHINHSRAVVFVGSCFSDNIAAEMSRDMFEVFVNPTGVMYNPRSIASAIEFVVENQRFSQEDLVAHGGVWHSMNHHSRFSSVDATKAIAAMNNSIEECREILARASTLVVTLGTATCFVEKRSGIVVGNCHKFPSSDFVEQTMSVEEIAEILSRIVEKVNGFNPSINFIFTVSPVRYLSHGLHASSLNKARLHLAIEKVVEKYPTRCEYFPAYEIVIDDLRDYRFFADDMVHPTGKAVEYVYEIFAQTYFDKSTIELAKKLRKLKLRLNHRFLTDNIEAQKVFVDETNRQIRELAGKYPQLASRMQMLKPNEI